MSSWVLSGTLNSARSPGTWEQNISQMGERDAKCIEGRGMEKKCEQHPDT